MRRLSVESSSIKSIGYEESSQTLEIEFHQYGTFRYFDFPEFLYKGFVLAPSKGTFFNQRIANRYRFEEIGRRGSQSEGQEQ